MRSAAPRIMAAVVRVTSGFAVHAAQLQRPLAVETNRVPGRPQQVPAGLGEVSSLDTGPVHGSEPGSIAVELLFDQMFSVVGVG